MKTIKKCVSCGHIAFGGVECCAKCGSNKFHFVEDDELTLRDGICYVEHLEKGAQYDERKCLAYLSDIVPSLRREQMILRTAFRCGAVKSLSSGTDKGVAEAVQFMENAGMREDAVGVVLQAYGLQISTERRLQSLKASPNPPQNEQSVQQFGPSQSLQPSRLTAVRRIRDFGWLVALVACAMLVFVNVKQSENYPSINTRALSDESVNESVVDNDQKSKLLDMENNSNASTHELSTSSEQGKSSVIHSNQTRSTLETTDEDGKRDVEAQQNNVQSTLYLEDCQIIESDSYQGNQGDSFVDVIGTNRFSRGRIDVDRNVYQHGIEVWIARWNYEKERSWAYADFKVESKYTDIDGKVVLIDSYNTTQFDSTLNFYGDGELLQSYELRPDIIPFDFNVNIRDVDTLRIYVNDEVDVSGGTSFGLVECILTN